MVWWSNGKSWIIWSSYLSSWRSFWLIQLFSSFLFACICIISHCIFSFFCVCWKIQNNNKLGDILIINLICFFYLQIRIKMWCYFLKRLHVQINHQLTWDFNWLYIYLESVDVIQGLQTNCGHFLRFHYQDYLCQLYRIPWLSR